MEEIDQLDQDEDEGAIPMIVGGSGEAESEMQSPLESGAAAPRRKRRGDSRMHKYWKNIDERFLKAWLGGRPRKATAAAAGDGSGVSGGTATARRRINTVDDVLRQSALHVSLDGGEGSNLGEVALVDDVFDSAAPERRPTDAAVAQNKHLRVASAAARRKRTLSASARQLLDVDNDDVLPAASLMFDTIADSIDLNGLRASSANVASHTKSQQQQQQQQQHQQQKQHPAANENFGAEDDDFEDDDFRIPMSGVGFELDSMQKK